MLRRLSPLCLFEVEQPLTLVWCAQREEQLKDEARMEGQDISALAQTVCYSCALGDFGHSYILSQHEESRSSVAHQGAGFVAPGIAPLLVPAPCATRPLTACTRNDCFRRVARKSVRLLTRGLPDGLSRMGRGERWARQHHGLGYLQRRQNPRGALVRGCPGLCFYGGGARMPTRALLWHASFVGLLC